MAHESWPRCGSCHGHGCAECEGGRTRPEGWVDTEVDGVEEDGVTPVRRVKGTADYIHEDGLPLEHALEASANQATLPKPGENDYPSFSRWLERLKRA